MAQEKKLFYDPDSKFLWVQDGENRIPLYTLANLNHETTRLTNEGYLQVKDSSTGNWDTVTDSEGNYVSLKGKDGKDGVNGKDGVTDQEYVIQQLINASLSYHLELSSDSDQVHVDSNESNKVVTSHSISTDVSLFLGGDLYPLEDTEWRLFVDSAGLPGTVMIDQGYNKITIVFNKGITIPNQDSFVYRIHAKLFSPEGTILKDIFKDFKVYKVSGTSDYDLDVNPGYLKVLKSGNFSQSAVKVKIKKTSIGTSSDIVYLTPSELPTDWSVYYAWSGGELKLLNSESIDLSSESTKTDSDTLRVYLKYKGLEVHQKIIEVITDGSDGISPGHIELSDDFTQFKAVNNVTSNQCNFNFDVSYIKGSTLVELYPSDIYIPDSSQYKITSVTSTTIEGVKSVHVSGYIPKGITILEQLIKVPIQVGVLTKTYTLSKTSNQYKYRLEATPGLIRGTQSSSSRNSTWKLDSNTITLKVYQSEIGVDSTKEVLLQTLPTAFELYYEVDGEFGEYLTYHNGAAFCEVPYSEQSSTLPGKLVFHLEDDNNLTVDRNEVAIVADGRNLVPYQVNLTNDSDQLLLTSKGLVLDSAKNFTTSIQVYDGNSELSRNEYVIEVQSKPGLYTVSESDGEVNISFEEKTFTSADMQLIKIPITVKIFESSEEIFKVTKYFNIYPKTGSEKYQLQIHPSTLIVDKNGQVTQSSLRVSVDKISYTDGNLSKFAINWIDEGYDVYYTIEGDWATQTEIKSISEAGGKYYGDVSLSSIDFNTARPYINVYLQKEGEDIPYEQELISSTLDGIDGADGKDGRDGINASGYIIDYTNESDQLYVTQDRKPYNGQEIETYINFYDGTKLLYPSEDYTLSVSYDGTETQVVNQPILTPDDDKHAYHVKFTYDSTSSISAGINSIQYTVTAILADGEEITKIYSVPIFMSDTDYDITVTSDNVIHVDTNNNTLPNVVSVQVTKRFLGGGGGSSQTSGPVKYEDYAAEGISLKYGIGPTSTSANTYVNFDKESSATGTISLKEESLDWSHPNFIRIELYKDDALRDVETIPFLKDGEKGDPGNSPIIVDLSNDMDNINTIGGKVLYSETVTTEASLHQGGSLLNLNDWTVSAKLSSSKKSASCTKNTNKVSIAYTFSPNDSVEDIVITFSKSGTILTKTFKIAKIEGRYDYDLIVSPSVLTYNKNGQLATSNVIVNVLKRVVGDPNSSPELLASLPSGLTLSSNPVISNLQIGTNTISNVVSLSTYSDTKQLLIQLKQGSTVIDECRLESVKNGTDGTNGTNGQSAFTSQVFYRSDTTPSTPTGGSFSSPKPTTTGWEDGVPEGNSKLWMSKRVFTSDGKIPQTSTWTIPKVVSTSAGFEVKFSTVASSPGTPSTNSSNWTDDASSSTIWMATRSQSQGTWSSWTVAKIKGEKGDSGAVAKQLICTSGNEHTFYLNPSNKPLQTKQTWKPTFALLEGNTQTELEYDAIEWTLPSKFSENSSEGIIISRNNTYECATHSITAEYAAGTKTYTCTLYATCVQGTLSYDLKCSPGYIKKTSSGSYQPIEFSASVECYGGGYSEEFDATLTTGSSGLALFRSVSGGDDQQIITGLSDGKITFTPTSDLMKFTLKNNGQMVDFELLTVVKDGEGLITVIPENPQIGDTIIIGSDGITPPASCRYLVDTLDFLPNQTYMFVKMPAMLSDSTFQTGVTSPGFTPFVFNWNTKTYSGSGTGEGIYSSVVDEDLPEVWASTNLSVRSKQQDRLDLFQDQIRMAKLIKIGGLTPRNQTDVRSYLIASYKTDNKYYLNNVDITEELRILTRTDSASNMPDQLRWYISQKNQPIDKNLCLLDVFIKFNPKSSPNPGIGQSVWKLITDPLAGLGWSFCKYDKEFVSQYPTS